MWSVKNYNSVYTGRAHPAGVIIGRAHDSLLPVSSSVAARQRPPHGADVLLPAAPAALHQPGRPGRAAALLHPQLPLHRHGQLHADPQHRAGGQLRQRGLTERRARAATANWVMNVTPPNAMHIYALKNNKEKKEKRKRRNTLFNGQTFLVVYYVCMLVLFKDVRGDVFIAVITLSQHDTGTEE